MFEATRHKRETKKAQELEQRTTPNLTQQAAAAESQRSEATDKIQKSILSFKQKLNAPKTAAKKKTPATKRKQLATEKPRKRQPTVTDPAVVVAPRHRQ